MPIRIPHRFYDRLEYIGTSGVLRTIILGTFNPAHLNLTAVPVEYVDTLTTIFSRKKYQRFNQVKNFYDRPQNRFWGILDRLNNPDLYVENGIRFKNPTGLKFYKGSDRQVVFDRQQQFCNANGIFISDIVKAIHTANFDNVYNNFSDTVVDKDATEFNTDHLLKIIEDNPSAKLILNVNESTAIPRITAQIRRLKEAAGANRIPRVSSTSGAAGGHYAGLVSNWKRALTLNTELHEK